MVNESLKRGIAIARLKSIESERLDLATIKPYLCKICKKVCSNIKKCSSCKGSFCMFCINEYSLEKKGQCICESIYQEGNLTDEEITYLKNIKIQCSKNGCGISVCFFDIEDHELNCAKESSKMTIETAKNPLRFFIICLVFIFALSVVLIPVSLKYDSLQKETNQLREQNSYIIDNIRILSEELSSLQNQLKLINNKFGLDTQRFPGHSLNDISRMEKIIWNNGNTTATNKIQYGSTLSSINKLEGNFRVVLKIIKMKGPMYLGLSRNPIIGLQGMIFFTKGYEDAVILNLQTGDVLAYMQKMQYTKRQFNEGDILTLIYKNSNLYFTLNGIDLGLAYANIKLDRPFISAFIDYDDQLELLGVLNID
jgi:hypothetical protein